MGSNNSNPEYEQWQLSSIKRRYSSYSNEIHMNIENIENFKHQKYEEITYDIKGVLQNPELTILPSDLFYIAVCYPYYCQSVPDMIRQAIRTECIKEEERKSQQHKNFEFSKNMDFSRVKVLERCKYRQKLTTLLKYANSLSIPYVERDNNNQIIQHKETTFDQILILLRNRWSKQYRAILENMLSNFNELTGKPLEELRQTEIALPILSQLMGNDDYNAFVPHRSLIWDEIDSEFMNLNNDLETTNPRCCINFMSSEPLNSITITGKVIKHGICSNGNFLFVLTNNVPSVLIAFLIYNGMIYQKIYSGTVPKNLKIDDNTFMFCSHENLFVKDSNNIYKCPIHQFLIQETINFTQVENNFPVVDKACSNGVTYSIISKENVKIFDAQNEKLIIDAYPSSLKKYSNKKNLFVSNGMFIGFISKESIEFITIYPQVHSLLFEKNNGFPKDFSSEVQAVTIDIISNCYFTVTHNGEESKIISHIYTGPPDPYLFGLNINIDNIENNSNNNFFNRSKNKHRNDAENNLLELNLLKYLLPCAFSPTIPDHLIASSDVKDSLKSIVIWIQKYSDNINLTQSLLILIDLNFQKQKDRDIALFILPKLKDFLNNENYKLLASALIINNFDLFFTQIDVDEFKILDMILKASNNDAYVEWVLNKLSQSSLLSKIVVNEEFLKELFSNDWSSMSRYNDSNAFKCDILLIAQQKSFEEAASIVEKDSLNLNDSELVISLCQYATFLLSQFIEVIKKIIDENPNKKDRSLDDDSILYALISNFFALAAPITGSIPFADAITNENAQEIIRLLNDEFELGEDLELFIGYFDMIFTISISSLIRGGSPYQCEEDYKWIIYDNFSNGDRILFPQDLSEIRFFFESHYNQLYEIVKENLPYFYDKIQNLKPRNDVFIDQLILTMFFHQTNTIHLIMERKEDGSVSSEMRFICNWMKKMRNLFCSKRQSEINSNSSTNQKQSNNFLANILILINLDPVLADYLEKDSSERSNYTRILQQFIQNNEPYLFHKILKAIPKRSQNALNGLHKLNSLFKSIKNPSFYRVIIDGLSRVDSFERLGYLISHSELNENAISTLEKFYNSCRTLLNDSQQISVLEILYTVLASCKNFNDKAIEIMNHLTDEKLKFFKDENCLSNPYFMTIAGLAESTSAVPEELKNFHQLAQACIIQLIFSKESVPTLTVHDLNNNNVFIKINDTFKSPIWIKMLFTIFTKCNDEEEEEEKTLRESMYDIFNYIAERLEKDQCYVFSTLTEMVYGFREILNSNTKLSFSLQTLLASITIDSSIGYIFLLFAIIGGDISDFSNIYAIQNQQGMWLKYTNKDVEYCLSIPITPLSENKKFGINEITDSVQEKELILEKGLSFDTILAFGKVCMKDQQSLLCRFYLQTLIKYIEANEEMPEKSLPSLAEFAKPYINFHILSSNQTKLYKYLNESFNLTNELIPEHEKGFGVITQSKLTHLFAYNIMKNIEIKATIQCNGYIILHKQIPVVIQIPTGFCYEINVEGFQTNKNIIINNNYVHIICYETTIFINDHSFPAEPWTSIEFIVEDIKKVAFLSNKCDFTNSQEFFDDENSINVQYSNDIFPNDGHCSDFPEEIDSFQPIKFKSVTATLIERLKMNILYNKIIDEYCFNEKLPFKGSRSMYKILCSKNEFYICNQLKSVILAQIAVKNPQLLNPSTSLSLIKSAVVAVAKFNKMKLHEQQFPYIIENGFFLSCSLDFIQSSNVQIFFKAIKNLIKSETFMDELGKYLVIMAQDGIYHSLVHKRDLVFTFKDEFEHISNKYYLIDLGQNSMGRIEIDSGSWINDTPIVLLLLLWILIDNCTTSQQRICAKLIIVDCMLIKSPMIDKFMPEFLAYIQNNLLFMPDDFNEIYIAHLSTLAFQYQDNYEIMHFYNCEKNCYKMRSLMMDSLITNFGIHLKEAENIDLNSRCHDLNSTKMNELILLLKKYKSVDDFPVWYFLPIWKAIASIVYEKISNDDIFNQIEYKIKAERLKDEQLTNEQFKNDVKLFAVDWSDSDTEELLTECMKIDFKSDDFTPILIKTLKMSSLIEKYGIHVVQCKVYCHYMLDIFYDAQNSENDVIRRLGREYSKYFAYQNRTNQLIIDTGPSDPSDYNSYIFSLVLGKEAITLDGKSALQYMKGEINDYKASMIYQLSEAVKKYKIERFSCLVWKIKFEGSDTIDFTGATNQTIIFALNSFLYSKTGLCIISPNFTADTPNDMGDTLVIPYTTNEDNDTNNMLFAFGIVLGSMIRCGLNQDVPFPLFIWNYLAGRQITKEDVYENDFRLLDQITKMKKGEINDQTWTYRDWNNIIKPILGFPVDKIVSKDSVELYETLVIDLRIKSLSKTMNKIRDGFRINQKIRDSSMLSGGLISFLCQGTKEINKQDLIENRIFYQNGNVEMINRFKTILYEYNQDQISKFIQFVTARPRPPNFSVVPGYRIIVVFDNEARETSCPIASTCFNTIHVPMYPTLDIMREKLSLAIQYCNEMDNK